MSFLDLTDSFSGTTLDPRWSIINEDYWTGAPTPPANHWEVSGGSVRLYANATGAVDRAVMGVTLGVMSSIHYPGDITTPYWMPGCVTVMKIGLPTSYGGSTQIRWGILNAISDPLIEATSTGSSWTLRRLYEGGPGVAWDPAKPWFRFTCTALGYTIDRSADGSTWEAMFVGTLGYNDPRDLTGVPGARIVTYSTTDLELSVDEMQVHYSSQMPPYWDGSLGGISNGASIGSIAVDPQPPPANDDFVNAIPIEISTDGGTFVSPAVNNAGATIESGEPNVSLGDHGRTVWWSYTPQSAGTVEVDTRLSTWAVDPPPEPGPSATYDFNDLSDFTAYTRHSGTVTADGELHLLAGRTDVGDGLAEDDTAAALSAASVRSTLVGQRFEAVLRLPDSADSTRLLIRLAADPDNDTWTAITGIDGSHPEIVFDQLLSIELRPVGGGQWECLFGELDSAGGIHYASSSLTFPRTADGMMAIRMDLATTAQLSVSLEDWATWATSAGVGELTLNSNWGQPVWLAFTNEGGEVTPRQFDIDTVTFSDTPPPTPNVSNPDTVLGVYTGSAVDSLTQVGFNDDTDLPVSENLTSRISFSADADTTYYMQLGMYADDAPAADVVLRVTGPASVVVPAYDLAVLADGPVLYWPLDDDDTSTAQDTSGHEHHGTGSGTRVTGVHDGSLFARELGGGAVQYAGEALTTGADFSIEFWLSTTETESYISAAIVNGTTSAVVQLLGNHPTPGGLALVWFPGDGGTGDAVLIPDTNFNDGDPHYFVIRATGAQLALFFDGQQVGSVGYSGGIYAFDQFSVTPYSGLATFDSVAVYDGAVPDERMTAHYLEGGAPPPPTLGQRSVEVADRTAVEPGQIWTLLVSAKSAAPQAGVQPYLKLYNGNTQTGTTLTTTGYTALSNVDYVPALTTYTIPDDGSVTHIRAAVGFQGLDVTNGTAFDFREVALERATPQSARYFDGSTISTTGEYLWEGTPHASRSHYYAQRTFKVARLRQLVQNFVSHGSSIGFRFAQDYPGDYPHDWAVANYNFTTVEPPPVGVYADLTLRWTRSLTFADLTGIYNDYAELAALNDTYDDLNTGRRYTWDNLRDTYADYNAITASGLSWATLAQGY